jgi:SAM-dependent methyltransferase
MSKPRIATPFPRFLAEVARVLRPGGHFLYADVRPRNRFAAWDAALAAAPLRMVSLTDVTREVLRGIEKNTHWSLNLVDRHQPAFLRAFGRKFAIAQGSQVYRDLQRGELSFRMYWFAKD